MRFPSLRQRRRYFHVNTSKSGERQETIALLRGERYSSHLLFTCFLVLSLTSGCGVSVKRRRCDHSAISASVETSLGGARNRRLFRFPAVAGARRVFFFCFRQRKITIRQKPSSRTDRDFNKTETRKETRKLGFDECSPVPQFGSKRC